MNACYEFDIRECMVYVAEFYAELHAFANGFGVALAVLLVNYAFQRWAGVGGSGGSGKDGAPGKAHGRAKPSALTVTDTVPDNASGSGKEAAKQANGNGTEAGSAGSLRIDSPRGAPSQASVHRAARDKSVLLSGDGNLRRSKTRVSEGDGLTPLRERLGKTLSPTFAGQGTRPVVLAVCGGSGSGKTTLSTAVFEALGADHITFISHDNYYKDLSHLPPEERKERNFDHPDALDTELLLEHVEALLRGEEVEVPQYDFGTHTRKAETIHMVARPIILIEGILIFAHDKLADLFDIKIFVDTDADTRFIRRLLRDVRERGRDVSGVVDQYLSTVRPMHIRVSSPMHAKAMRPG